MISNAQERDDREDALASARYDADKGAGELRTISHHEARERLGLAET